jgi:CRISPR-associated protein Cmr6
MIRGLDQAAKSLGITPTVKFTKNTDVDHSSNLPEEEEVPMMYRAQVDGRCSLMFAGSNKDLERWKDEWIDPKPEQPRYQKKEESLGLDGKVYRIAVNFPFRLLSNCGQDSILRPILGKDGIPFLSGSSVKGPFRRACLNTDQVKKYCGDDENLAPSKLGFRFHGAYPVGDWSGMHKVKFKKQGQEITEVRYQMLDVVHPQQERQVGSEKSRNATALASISLHKPRMIFEFSSADPNTDWDEVETIFWRAIARGIGGKTSTGYGMGGYNDQHPATVSSSRFQVALKAQGVSSTLRSDEPEFRPNLFKASLRGHFQRLLAGVIGDRSQIDAEVNRLFGSSASQGAIQLFWEQRKDVEYGRFGATQTFRANGLLHLNALRGEDVNLIEQVLKFAFIMGGFGKSWRRASHELFHRTYKKFEIGCHWEMLDMEQSWIGIQSADDLKIFLTEMHQTYTSQFSSGRAVAMDWREAWHPERLLVYAAVTQTSKAIQLFHDGIYKETPAIGGKNPGDKRPKFISSIWHRMLPIGNGNFLEIVTIFCGQRQDWTHRTEGDQLQNFMASLQHAGLSHTWGSRNPPGKKVKKIIPNPVK